MCRALKNKRIEKEIITLTIIGLFCEKFWYYLDLTEQPTLSVMREIFKWIRNCAHSTFDPYEIIELRRCWL
jgi:hypothetical protein